MELVDNIKTLCTENISANFKLNFSSNKNNKNGKPL